MIPLNNGTSEANPSTTANAASWMSESDVVTHSQSIGPDRKNGVISGMYRIGSPIPRQCTQRAIRSLLT